MKTFFRSKGFRELLRVLLALSIGLCLGFIITCFVSKDPVASYKAFLFGPLTQLNRIGDWLEESTTLIFLGLAVAIVFAAKQFYIGVEGQMVLGALVTGFVVLYAPFPPVVRVILAFFAASATGFIWGVIPAYVKAYLNASELVSSLMMNTIALKLFEFILSKYLQQPKVSGIMSNLFPPEVRLGSFIPNLPFLASTRALWEKQTSVSIMIYVAIAAVIVAYLMLYKTPFGYELRMVGSNDKFARYGGVNVKRIVMLSICISGIFAGLAGVHVALAILHRIVLNMSGGLGFEGVNIAILSFNNPLIVPFASLLYGYLRAGADVMERTTDVSRELVTIVQAAVLLLITAERLLPVIQQRVTTPDEEFVVKKEGETDVA
jgi:general nucleoside transport system permease protein